MKEVIVLSGKGGTGKTSIVGSFAAVADKKILVDCDVDAADLHLLLKPFVKASHEFWSGQVAFIDEQKCNQCRLCLEVCRFDSIKDFKIDPASCEGCGFCSRICPTKAIIMKENKAGYWMLSESKYGALVHARLGIAQENSGKLVAFIRQQARQLAEKIEADYIISDGPPGIGCPVISALSGVDLALLVTEPTLSGIHDLKRVLDVCHYFHVTPLVCINKHDINEEYSLQIECYCAEHNTEVVSKIPFNDVVTSAMMEGLPVIEYSDNEVGREIDLLWNSILTRLSHT